MQCMRSGLHERSDSPEIRVMRFDANAGRSRPARLAAAPGSGYLAFGRGGRGSRHQPTRHGCSPLRSVRRSLQRMNIVMVPGVAGSTHLPSSGWRLVLVAHSQRTRSTHALDPTARVGTRSMCSRRRRGASGGLHEGRSLPVRALPRRHRRVPVRLDRPAASWLATIRSRSPRRRARAAPHGRASVAAFCLRPQ